MENSDDDIQIQKLIPIVVLSVGLVGAVFLEVRGAAAKPGTVVLPGGITYTGPTPSQAASPTLPSSLQNGKIPVETNATWITQKGTVFPYTFAHPSLSLGVFPNDPYDGVTVFYPGTDSQSNLFFRVDDLTKMNKKSYINKPKSAYVNDWWKDYSWQGVASVTKFTNANGLVGFRARYTDQTGDEPYEHVFFEVPQRKDLVIWMSGKLFSQDVFDRIVDSVTWVQ